MNAKWSDFNKKMQIQIKKTVPFYAGIDMLLELRKELMKQIIGFKELLTFLN